MTIRFSLMLGPAIATFAAAASMAADAPANKPTTSETVTVTAPRERDQAPDLRSDVRRFIDGHAKPSPRILQIARWKAPICPSTRGLPAAYNAFVSTHVRQAATDAHVAVSTDATCRPNIDIIFTDEPQKLIAYIADHYDWMIGYHYLQQTDAMATIRRPIQAWYTTATQGGPLTLVDDPYKPMPPGAAGSRLSNGLRSLFWHVLIIADAKALGGHEMGPIADYVAMLALAQAPDQEGCAPLPTILDLLAPGCDAPPAALTAEDKSFLTGLYAMDNTAIGNIERGQIAGRMNDAATQQTPPQQ